MFSAATVAGFFDRAAWFLELAAHFRIHCLAGLLATLFALATLGRRRWALLFGGFAAADLVLVLPAFLAHGPAAPADAPRLRVAVLNLLTSNERYDDALDEVRRLDPDLFVALETDGRWLERLAELSESYPYSIADPRSDNFGIALFSRLPLDRTRIVHFGRAGVPSLLAELRVGGRRLTVIGTHVVPPLGATGASLRNDQLAELADFTARRDGAVLLLGDLNCTPWSSYFRTLLRQAGLSDGGRGAGATWPAPLGPFGIPIDHVLHSAGLTPLERTVGEAFGSDHLPVAAGFALGQP